MPDSTESITSDADRIPVADLAAVIERRLLRDGMGAAAAALLGRNHAECERDAALSHGVFRVPQYAVSLETGYLNGVAEPVIEQPSPTFFRIDADGGVAQLALERARAAIEAAVEQHGSAVVAIRDSHHHSELWPDLEPFARRGWFGLSMVTAGSPFVAPEGARAPVLGTNPYAFATPVAGADPLIADFATSAMAMGDVTLHANAGREVPLGTGLDAQGNDTTDAAAIIDGGTLLPFGRHKGAALSMMVEVLASALTGGAFSHQTPQQKPQGVRTNRTGQFLLLIDPDFGGDGGHAERVSGFVAALAEAGVDRMPADRRYRARAAADADGIPVTDAIRELLAEDAAAIA